MACKCSFCFRLPSSVPWKRSSEKGGRWDERRSLIHHEGGRTANPGSLPRVAEPMRNPSWHHVLEGRAFLRPSLSVDTEMKLIINTSILTEKCCVIRHSFLNFFPHSSTFFSESKSQACFGCPGEALGKWLVLSFLKAVCGSTPTDEEMLMLHGFHQNRRALSPGPLWALSCSLSRMISQLNHLSILKCFV